MPTLAFLIYTALMVVLQIKAGYMAGRYLIPILPFVGMLAVVGMEAMLRRLMMLPVMSRRFTPVQVLDFVVERSLRDACWRQDCFTFPVGLSRCINVALVIWRRRTGWIGTVSPALVFLIRLR